MKAASSSLLAQKDANRFDGCTVRLVDSTHNRCLSFDGSSKVSTAPECTRDNATKLPTSTQWIFEFSPADNAYKLHPATAPTLCLATEGNGQASDLVCQPVGSKGSLWVVATDANNAVTISTIVKGKTKYLFYRAANRADDGFFASEMKDFDRGNKGLGPSHFVIVFDSIGEKAWVNLINAQTPLQAACCSLAGTDKASKMPEHFVQACKTAKPVCTNSVSTVCSSLKSFNDPACVSLCTSTAETAKVCDGLISTYCAKNKSDPLCVCLDDKKFLDWKKNTKLEGLPFCVYPACANSAHGRIRAVWKECPPDQIQIQQCLITNNITSIKDKAQLSSSCPNMSQSAQSKVSQPASTTPKPAATASKGTPPSASTPPAAAAKAAPASASFWDTWFGSAAPAFWGYPWYYFAGGAAVLLLLLFLMKSKSE